MKYNQQSLLWLLKDLEAKTKTILNILSIHLLHTFKFIRIRPQLQHLSSRKGSCLYRNRAIFAKSLKIHKRAQILRTWTDLSVLFRLLAFLWRAFAKGSDNVCNQDHIGGSSSRTTTDKRTAKKVLTSEERRQWEKHHCNGEDHELTHHGANVSIRQVRNSRFP